MKKWLSAILMLVLLLQTLPLNALAASGHVLTEEELQQFYRENQMLLNKFFTDSDKMRGTPATASETDVKGTERNIARNAEKLLGKMREILARRLLM